GIIRGAQRVPGYVGSALEFDGFDDYLDLDYTVGAHLDGASGVTVSGWVKLDSYERGMALLGSRINGGRAGVEVTLRGNVGVVQVSGRSQNGDAFNNQQFD